MDEKARALLAKPLVGRMSVIDKNGFPHTVPVWHMLDGDDIVVFSYIETRKVEYVRANPKGCITIGGDPAGTEGYLIKGMWSVEPDNDWSKTITYHYNGEQRGEELIKEWGDIEYVVLRLKPAKITKV